MINEFPRDIIIAMDTVLGVVLEWKGISQRFVNSLDRLADVLIPHISNPVKQAQFNAFAQSKVSYQEMFDLLNKFDEILLSNSYGLGDSYNFMEGQSVLSNAVAKFNLSTGQYSYDQRF